MQADNSLEDLEARFERLVLKRSESTLSEARKRSIKDKFANKSLQELNEIALKLES